MRIKKEVRNFLERETQRKIENDSEDLVDADVLDSFSMMKLFSFISDELGVDLDMENITQKNFNSLNTISAMIEHANKESK